MTGPGGTGKSFNLARFVMELRSEGHVVAYVPTMDNVIGSPALLVQELVHAVTGVGEAELAHPRASRHRQHSSAMPEGPVPSHCW